MRTERSTTTEDRKEATEGARCFFINILDIVQRAQKGALVLYSAWYSATAPEHLPVLVGPTGIRQGKQWRQE